jgi:eukaryotic-like serine/threonine-protein kinase
MPIDPDATPVARQGAVRPAGPLERGALVDRYVIVERLGEGGMGVVFAAYDPDLDRKIAIKMLRERGDAESNARFLREAKAMARLRHANVIAVHDVGVHGGQVFVAMEIVEGKTLRRWLAEPGRRPLREVLARFVLAGRGLAAAHHAGIVHRDFKPDNVMVATDGRIVVTDFGLALVERDGEVGLEVNEPVPDPAHDPAAAPRLTATGTVMGTPAYMSPEQHRGLLADAASDQFSFCVALYEALYGELPFAPSESSPTDSTVLALAVAVIEGQLRPEPAGTSVPRWVRAAVTRGLATEPARRWPSMDALLAALAADPARRRRRIAVAAAGGAVLVAAGLGIARLAGDDAPPCNDGAATWAGVWDADRTSSLRTAVAAARPADGGARADGAVASLDRYVVDWRAARLAACRAGRRGEIPAADAIARAHCLDHARGAAGALVTVLLDHPSGELVDDAPTLISELPSPADCATAGVAAGARPIDPSLAAAIELAEAQRKAGRYDVALATARRAREAATAAGDARAIAAASLAIGLALSDLEDGDATVELRRATDEAGAVNDWHGAAEALIARVNDDLARGGTDAEALLAQVEVVMPRVAEPRIRNQLTLAQADALVRSGDVAAGAVLCRTAVDETERLFGARSYRVAIALAQCADAELARADNQAALELLTRGLDVMVGELGAEHPNTANMRHSLAIAHRRLGHIQEALRQYEAALVVRERVYGSASPFVADSLNSIAMARFAAGDANGARDAADRYLVAAEGAFGPTSRRAAAAHMVVAQYAWETGAKDEVRPHVERAFALLAATPIEGPDIELAWLQLQWADLAIPLGDPAAAVDAATSAAATFTTAGDPAAAYAHLVTGKAELARKRPADAIAPLERAVASLDPSQHAPAEVADAEYALAQALHRSGRDRARAKVLATTARKRLIEAGDDSTPLRAALDAWVRDPH